MEWNDEHAVRFNTAGVTFLMAELDTAWMFVQMARAHSSRESRSHLVLMAERAFREALYRRPQLHLTEVEDLRFQERRSALESELAQLAWEVAFDHEEQDAA